MKLVVIGTGPGAQALASMNAENPMFSEVVLLESQEGKIDRNTKISWPDGSCSNLKGCIITSNPFVAIPDADVILLCNPANSYPKILEKISDHITSVTKLICGVPGATGFDWMVRDAFAGKPKLFNVAAVESLPFISKRDGENKVRVYAFKHQLYLATTSFDDSVKESDIDLEGILGVSLKKLNVFLSLTLLNPNAKVHPLLFLEALKHSQDQADRNVYILGDENAAYLEKIEKEVYSIAASVELKTGIKLDHIPSLKEWFTGCYQSIIQDNSTAQTCLATHKIYNELKDDFLKGINDSNANESDQGKSRYLTEEIPYGLICFKGLAELVKVDTPTIDFVLEQCQNFLTKRYFKNGKLSKEVLTDTVAPQRFGIDVLTKLSRQYQVHSTEKKQEVKEFDENGIVFFGKVLPREKCFQIQQTVSEKISDVDAVDTEKLLLNLHWKDRRFADFCSAPEFVSAACDLLQVEDVRVFSSLIVFKKPNEKMPVPWHQDPAYQWPIEPLECASLWFALDDVTNQNGAMNMAVGGHKVGILPMRPTPPLVDGEYHFSPQLAESISEEHLTGFPIVKCDMLQYESSFHHSMMPHSSPLNFSQSRRCAFIVRYCKGNTKINLYPGMPRENFFRNYKLYNPHKEYAAQ